MLEGRYITILPIDFKNKRESVFYLDVVLSERESVFYLDGDLECEQMRVRMRETDREETRVRVRERERE